jgi:hypothetical protein
MVHAVFVVLADMCQFFTEAAAIGLTITSLAACEHAVTMASRIVRSRTRWHQQNSNKQGSAVDPYQGYRHESPARSVISRTRSFCRKEIS